MFPTVLDSLPAEVPEPFPHVVVRSAIPEAMYARLEYEFPPLSEFYDADRVPNNKRIDLASKFNLGKHLGYSDAWKAFIRAHVGQRFWANLWDIFGGSIAREFPECHVDPNGDVTPRWAKLKSEIRLDCAIGVNSPVHIKGSVRRAHVDRPTKMLAGLFYLPLKGDTAGGDLILYRKTGSLQYDGKSQVQNLAALEEAVRVPYQRNTAVFYLNSPASIHGVTDREVTVLPRRLVSFACCWREPMFRTQ